MDTAATWAIAVSVLAGLAGAAAAIVRTLHQEARGLRAAITRSGAATTPTTTVVGENKGQPKPQMTSEEVLRFISGKERPTPTAEDEAWVRETIAQLRASGDRSPA